MSQTRSRSVAIDLVRVIAVFGVVLRHAYYNPEGVVAQIVCPWAIAVFFVLSGYLWSSRKTFTQEVDARATALLLPYVTWMVLISVPFFIYAFQAAETGFVFQLLAAAVIAPQLLVIPYSACWFFTVMFVAVVLLRYLERFPRRVTWIVLTASVAVAVFVPIIPRALPFGAGLGAVCMLFIVLGQEFRRIRPRITHPALVGLAFAVVGAAAAVLGATHNLQGELLEIKDANFGFPVLGLLTGVVISLGLLLLAEAAERFIPTMVGEFITESAGPATFMMFMHPVLLLLMNTPETGRFPDFLIALLVPYVIAMVCLRRGWVPWLTGAPRPPLPVSERLGRAPVVGGLWRAVARS